MAGQMDPLEGILSPIPRVLLVDESGPLSPLDEWYTEFGRVEVLRNLALLSLGYWHPPMAWRETPPAGWVPPLPWPPRLMLCTRESPERSISPSSKELNKVMDRIDKDNPSDKSSPSDKTSVNDNVSPPSDAHREEISEQRQGDLGGNNGDTAGDQSPVGAAHPDVAPSGSVPARTESTPIDKAKQPAAADENGQQNQGAISKTLSKKNNPGAKKSILPPDEFLRLGRKAYDAYWDFESARAKIYSYLRMQHIMRA